ncbi:hypothetical protein [Candidatus Albibeggiatoa sp. nov. BB20]
MRPRFNTPSVTDAYLVEL